MSKILRTVDALKVAHLWTVLENDKLRSEIARLKQDKAELVAFIDGVKDGVKYTSWFHEAKAMVAKHKER